MHESFRPTNKAAVQKTNGKGMEVGIADDQAKDFDFEKIYSAPTYISNQH